MVSTCESENFDNIAQQFLEKELKLSLELGVICFEAPVNYVYDPVLYACDPHGKFVAKYCNTTKEVLWVGMNPGPYGMAQTGVPFGEVNFVRDFLGITGKVNRPNSEHPKKPVMGFECRRSEVSGKRFWSLWKHLCKTPDHFFSSSFVHNYCPLKFVTATGKNITPPNVKREQRSELHRHCDEALIEVIRLLRVQTIVCIGKYVLQRTQACVQSQEDLKHIRVVSVMHPSPANPPANKGWHDIVTKQLEELGLLQLYQTSW